MTTQREPTAWHPIGTGALLGIGSAVLGLLPWLVTGMRLPLQNLWATETLPQDMPLVLLPFNQYTIALLAAVLVTGGAVAGIAARAWRDRLGGRGVVAALLGLVLVHAVAIGQTAVVVGPNLRDRSESTFYLASLIALSVLAALVAAAALWLIARAPRGGALVGLGIGALLLAPWLQGLIVPFGTIPGHTVMTAHGLVRWVPPVLVGLAIAWAGVNTVGRVAAALLTLLALWLVPALVIGATSAAGTRILARDPGGMIEYGIGVFGAAATSPNLVIGPLVAAVVVAALGLVVRSLRGAPAPAAASDPALDAAEELGPPR